MGAISTEMWQMLRLGWGTLLPWMGTWYPSPWLLSTKPPLLPPLSANSMSSTEASSGTWTSACRKPAPPGTTGLSSRGPIWAGWVPLHSQHASHREGARGWPRSYCFSARYAQALSDSIIYILQNMYMQMHDTYNALIERSPLQNTFSND